MKMSEIKVFLVDEDTTSIDKIKQYFSSHVVIEVTDVVYNENGLMVSFKPSDNNLQVVLTKILHELGVPSHIKGYTFIKEGINLIYNNPSLSITKEIYPIIAKKYHTKVYCVERAIRHAIEISWNRGNWEVMEEVFGYSIDNEKAKATNSEFIVTLADKLRMDYHE